jgi:hypothetical protein
LKLKVATLLLFAGCFVACGPETSSDDVTSRVSTDSGLKTSDLQKFGDDLTEAVRIHDIVFQTRATSNAQMVVTSEGNVVIDTGLPNQPRVQEMLRAALGE